MKLLIDTREQLDYACFFEKLAKQDKEHWRTIAEILMQSLQQKEIMAYFNDKNLQREVVANGFAGEVISTKKDYVQVAFSNVKGSKSDAVTANAFDLTSEVAPLGVGHRLVITRAHTGGDSPYPFYNKDNASYVRVYVPKGSVFDRISGNDMPDYKPLVNHKDLGFKTDADLVALEQGITHPVPGLDMFEESGKTVFAFWMITKPGKTSSATLVYHTPLELLNMERNAYELLWQKQSGAVGDKLHVSVKLPDSRVILNHSSDVQAVGSTAVYDAELSVDREVKVIYN